ncbi:MAG: sigma-70 family RNA polymerase sigma factor [Verrucomicrobia bacterium]|nr:sigma-70 family RNA polymerase sigma factor [Kiritimatiellia bacterium]MCO6401851.1 sigma-70 family RNA polymerase sigma factor [Verrucomicrobiota bacterium]
MSCEGFQGLEVGVGVNKLGRESSNTDEGIAPEVLAQMVARAQAGDEDAFGELVKAFHGRVFGVIYRMVSNAEDARELAQQTWVKAWQRLGTFKGDAQFFTWVYRIAVNTALDQGRRATRRREVSLDEEPGREPQAAVEWQAPDEGRPDRQLEREEVRKAFEAALDGLAAEHRMALILREVEGLSYREIAQAMRCRVGTVMSRIFYARRYVQDRMKDVR